MSEHPVVEASEEVIELLEAAWGIIANAGGGNWGLESEEWQAAAVRWREKFHEVLAHDELMGAGDD